jgi:hypothetical protein
MCIYTTVRISIITRSCLDTEIVGAIIILFVTAMAREIRKERRNSLPEYPASSAAQPLPALDSVQAGPLEQPEASDPLSTPQSALE